jgi:hypothetical protein
LWRDWNTKESSFAGYVTKFFVAEPYLAKFEPHIVGSGTHVEYWIPAELLQEFNASIQGLISVESGFFGSGFRGFAPEGFGLKGKDAIEQFVAMAKTWDYSRMDFVCEVSTNRKAVYLNFLFWAQFDFNSQGIVVQQRDSIIARDPPQHPCDRRQLWVPCAWLKFGNVISWLHGIIWKCFPKRLFHRAVFVSDY